MLCREVGSEEVESAQCDRLVAIQKIAVVKRRWIDELMYSSPGRVQRGQLNNAVVALYALPPT